VARATVPEEPVNPASYSGTEAPFLRDRNNQPDPIFPRSPGIIFESQLMQTFVSTNRQLVLSMNCEHHIKNPESVKKLICTCLFTMRDDASFASINVHACVPHFCEVIHSPKPPPNRRRE
jgi:hypothetical protein